MICVDCDGAGYTCKGACSGKTFCDDGQECPVCKGDGVIQPHGILPSIADQERADRAAGKEPRLELMEDQTVNPDDLEVDQYRICQLVGTTEDYNGIRITHKPTGIYAEAEGRGQVANRVEALKRLRLMLDSQGYDIEE
jgi:hypothetical protein